MIRQLFKKHNCYKTCFCEGRTSKDGIERMNAYSSLIYVLIAYIISLHKSKHPKFKYLLACVLSLLGVSSFYSHYYMNNLGNFCDNYTIILVILVFLFHNNIHIYTLYLLVLFLIAYTILETHRLKLTFIVIILFNYNVSRKARLEDKTNTLFYIINILLYISIFVWAYDYKQDKFCIHWLWHILTAIVFYLLFIWYEY